MNNQLYKINNTCFKINNNLFNYNPTYSNLPISGLFSPRDMEVYINPLDNLDQRIFICNATQDPDNLNNSITIRNFFKPNITLGSIDTSQYDSGNRPVGIALDLENNYFYTASLNRICKIQYDTNTLITYYENTGASFHDVVFDKINNIIYASDYVSNSGSLYTLNSNDLTLLHDTSNIEILPLIVSGANFLITVSANIATNMYFVCNWGNPGILSFRKNSNNRLIQNSNLSFTGSLPSTPNNYSPYGLCIVGDIMYISTNKGNLSLNGTIEKYSLSLSGNNIVYTYIERFDSGGRNPTGVVYDNINNRLLVANSSSNTINFIQL